MSLPTAESAGPAAASDGIRWPAPDMLRGIAVCMLFLTNVPLILSGIRYQEVAGFDIGTENVRDVIGWFVYHSTPTIMGIGIFVMLMGIGLARSHTAPGGFSLARRRFLAFGALGLVHGLFVWWGDILVYYAVAGLCILPLLRFPRRVLSAVGTALTAFPALITMADGIAQLGGVRAEVLRELARASTALLGQETTAMSRYTSGDLLSVEHQRLADWWGYVQEFAPIGLLQICGMFLVGIALARAGMFHPDHADHLYWRVMMRRVGPVAAALGVMGVVIRTYDTSAASVLGAFGSTATVISSPLLALWWCAAIMRHGPRLTRLRGGRCLAAIGQYSLSAYLACSVVCALAAYGLRLYGTIPLWGLELLAVVVMVAAGELALRARKRGRTGPAEALIRALTTRERRSP